MSFFSAVAVKHAALSERVGERAVPWLRRAEHTIPENLPVANGDKALFSSPDRVTHSSSK